MAVSAIEIAQSLSPSENVNEPSESSANDAAVSNNSHIMRIKAAYDAGVA